MGPCLGQAPAIFQNGVTQAASRLPAAIPGGVLAAGTRAHIAGIRFAPGKFTAKVEGGGLSRPAVVVSVSGDSAVVTLPSGLPPGDAVLRVARDGEWSNAVSIRIGKQSIGLYSRNGRGWGPGSFAGAASARSGDLVRLRAEGLAAGRKVRVRVGALEAEGAVGPGGLLGFRLPAGTSLGCYVPIQAVGAEELTSNIVTIEVKRGAEPCALHSSWPRPARNTAVLFVQKVDLLFDLQPIDVGASVEESAFASFFRLPPGDLISFHVIPPEGTCVAASYPYQFGDPLGGLLGIEIDDLRVLRLDAGPTFPVFGTNGEGTIRPRANGIYRGGFTRKSDGILGAGTMRVRGSGGKDIGPFAASIETVANLLWVRREDSAQLDRERDHRVEWDGADPLRPMLIAGFAADRQTTAAWAFFCAAKAGAKSFTIPKEILRNLPLTKSSNDLPFGILTLLQPRVASFAAKGLDQGTIFYSGSSSRSFIWR